MSTVGIFKPSRPDGRSDWRVVFELVEDLPPDSVVTLKQLREELGTENNSRVYRAVARANKELWGTRQKSMASVKGVGYRILKAKEMERLANSFRNQSRRKMSNAVAVIDATNLAELNDSERAWHTKVQAGLHILAAAMDAHEEKINTHAKLLEHLETRVRNIETRQLEG